MKTKNILIPTDFSIASIVAVTNLLNKYPDQKFNISMVHFMQLSDSITELLMLSRRASEYRHVSQEFEERFRALRENKKEQLVGFNYEFFYGSTIAVFRNFLEAKEVESIVNLKGHTYNKLTRQSIDPQLLISKSGYPVLEISTVILPMITTATAVVKDIPELQEV